MAYLQDLTVNKVSFVRRGANNKKFLLLKSHDFVEDNTNTDDKNTNGSGGYKVRKEVKDALATLLKSNKKDAVLDLLKKDDNLKITEQEIVEVTTTLEVMPKIDIVVKKEDNVDITSLVATVNALQKQNEEMAATIKKNAENQQKDGIRARLRKDCQYLPIAENEAVEQLYRLEHLDKAAADSLFKSWVQTSELTKSSKLFIEIGKTSDEDMSPSADYTREIVKETNELQKSGGTVSKADIIRRVVAKFGEARFEAYRKSFGKASHISDSPAS